MNYISIFETNDFSTFKKVETILKAYKIPYKTLHEYRLSIENDYGMLMDGAIITVKTNDFETANEILIKQQILPKPQDVEFIFIKKIKQLFKKKLKPGAISSFLKR